MPFFKPNNIENLFVFSLLQNPMAQIEEEKREHHNKMLKMEREMEEVISQKKNPKKLYYLNIFYV